MHDIPFLKTHNTFLYKRFWEVLQYTNNLTKNFPNLFDSKLSLFFMPHNIFYNQRKYSEIIITKSIWKRIRFHQDDRHRPYFLPLSINNEYVTPHKSDKYLDDSSIYSFIC